MEFFVFFVLLQLANKNGIKKKLVLEDISEMKRVRQLTYLSRMSQTAREFTKIRMWNLPIKNHDCEPLRGELE
jgi:hypothetical protein